MHLRNVARCADVRHARRWMPAWPALGAFFGVALLLWTMAFCGSHAVAAYGNADWPALTATLLTGIAVAVAAGIMGSVAAMAAMTDEIGLRRHRYGARSLRILLLAAIAAYVMSALGNALGNDADWIRVGGGDVDARVVPLTIGLLVAWPVAHLVGLAYGIAAQFHRDERPFLGVLGILLNGSALLLYVLFIFVDPPQPSLML